MLLQGAFTKRRFNREQKLLLTACQNAVHYPPSDHNVVMGWWLMSRGIGKVARVGRSSKSRSQRWRIRLSNGIDLYVDRDGRSFYSKEHAESTLDLIRAEMDPRHYRFDPDNYRQKKESRHTFRAFAESWLENVELKTASLRRQFRIPHSALRTPASSASAGRAGLPIRALPRGANGSAR